MGGGEPVDLDNVKEGLVDYDAPIVSSVPVAVEGVVGEDGEEVVEEVVDVYNVDADFDLDGEVNDEE